MKIQCPHCKSSFEVYDQDYAAIVAQIKTAEFDAEINRRIEEINLRHRTEQEALKSKVENSADRRVKEKQVEIDRLTLDSEKLRIHLQEADNQKMREIAAVAAEKDRQIADIAAQKEKSIAEIENQLQLKEKEHEIALIKQQNSIRDELHAKDQAISSLQASLEAQKLEAEKKLLEVNELNKALLQAKQEEIERYKDLKSKLSTKLLGETLEKHCHNMFNRARSQGQFPDAYFEKDNDASGGTKGDFIFRDYLDGDEYISIMFEMKNEDDMTATKHRNEDFFAKLDKDRREKKCEYAVLVSMLEADSEFYNEGIVDVSYRYDKMLVVRPQFFMSVITMLSRAARRGAERLIGMRRDLEAARAQSVDVTKFENRLEQFRQVFFKFTDAHVKKQNDAIANIDKVIESLEKQAEALRKVKSLFETSEQKLVRANETLENDFTIKKLTYGNPTMKAKFEEARKNNKE